jgi:hypothetical protein
MTDHHLFLGIDAVDLEYVLGDIQTDGGNLHLDGSPHVIPLDDHSMALRCRERAPSTTSKPAHLFNGRLSAFASCGNGLRE